jgi:hypothetical protein
MQTLCGKSNSKSDNVNIRSRINYSMSLSEAQSIIKPHILTAIAKFATGLACTNQCDKAIYKEKM